MEVGSDEDDIPVEVGQDSRLPVISEPVRLTFITYCAGTVILFWILLLLHKVFFRLIYSYIFSQPNVLRFSFPENLDMPGERTGI